MFSTQHIWGKNLSYFLLNLSMAILSAILKSVKDQIPQDTIIFWQSCDTGKIQ